MTIELKQEEQLQLSAVFVVALLLAPSCVVMGSSSTAANCSGVSGAASGPRASARPST